MMDDWRIPIKFLHAVERARPLCPDHQDKASGYNCLLCEIERLRGELETAHNAIIGDVNQRHDLAECRRLLREACVGVAAKRFSQWKDDTLKVLGMSEKELVEAINEAAARGDWE